MKTVRKTWWITRPERNPDHKIALLALDKATNHFSNIKWDHKSQINYEIWLGKLHAKRPGHSKNGSGGRTWVAMLKTFDYIYITKNRIIKPNEIALDIIKGINVYKNIRKQILILQIPNPYFLSSDFTRGSLLPKDFQIQPIRFLLKLANDKRLGYKISEKEIIYFAITCHKNSDLDKSVNNIIKFRQMTNNQRSLLEAKIAKSFDHRVRKDSPQRTFEQNMKDVANTCMILAEYTYLAKRTKGQHDSLLYSNNQLADKRNKVLKKFDYRYPFDKSCFSDIKASILREGLPVGKYKANYKSGEKTASAKSKDIRMVYSLINRHPELKNDTRNQIKHILMSSDGMAPFKAIKFANLIKKYEQTNSFSKTFQDQYLHEKDTANHNKNRQFELDTEYVLKHMGLDVEDHPEPVSSENNSNENEDAIITINNEYLILVDAKNYHNESDHSKFQLSAGLRNTMVNSYIKGYIGYKGMKPRYFLYVVANNATGLENMRHITDDSATILNNKCTGAIISANCLMQLASYEDLHKANKLTNERYLTKLCSTNELFITFGKIKDCLGLNG